MQVVGEEVFESGAGAEEGIQLVVVSVNEVEREGIEVRTDVDEVREEAISEGEVVACYAVGGGFGGEVSGCEVVVQGGERGLEEGGVEGGRRVWIVRKGEMGVVEWKVDLRTRDPR